MKFSVDQALRKARSAARIGEVPVAEQLYREILDRFPGNRTAASELKALLAPKLENPPEADLDRMAAGYRQGRWSEALALGQELLVRYPNGEILHNLVGAIYAAAARFDEAVHHYDCAITLAPDYPEALNNRANALAKQERLDAALSDLDEAIRLMPDFVEAHSNRAGILRRLVCRGPEAKSDQADAPAHAKSNQLPAQPRLSEALASYDRAIELCPTLAHAHFNRGVVLRQLQRLPEALESHERALSFKPDHAPACAELLHLYAHMCRWDDDAPRLAPLVEGNRQEAVPPSYVFTMTDDPEQHLAYARAWAREKFNGVQPGQSAPRSPKTKLRVGYFSADFHNHATMYLMARLFELHDADRFEIHAFSYGATSDDDMRRRLLTAVHAFHDVRHLNDREVAALANDHEIDIAVDLKGYTDGGRPGIFAHRAADVQVSYLGYPGTMGADFMDYIIADPVVIPEELRPSYSEKVVYLPHSYQVNDDRREISHVPVSRAECGLPEDGFVFCCFNNNYKVSPVEFDIWMRLLRSVDGSVLWLLKDSQFAADNLLREAAARGVDPARIVLADRAPLSVHLARHRCADLFLDTFNVNAHTTASDALWAGLPVLTKLGRSFVSRVAGSLLNAVGLPELVVETTPAYEQLALELATNPGRLKAVRERLAANRLQSPLFNTAQTTRDIEAVYDALCGRQSPAVLPSAPPLKAAA